MTNTKIGLNRVVLLGVLILLYLVFAIISPTFLSYSRILSSLNYAYFLGFLALGVTFAIATGGIDFSIGPVMFCAALIAGQLLTKSDLPVAVCLLVAILVGFLFGVLNGVMVAYAGLPPFITSMASMMICRGVGSIAVGGLSVTWPMKGKVGGWFRSIFRIQLGKLILPIGFLWVILIVLLMTYLLNHTRTGRYIIAIGSNQEATRLSGIKVVRYHMARHS